MKANPPRLRPHSFSLAAPWAPVLVTRARAALAGLMPIFLRALLPALLVSGCATAPTPPPAPAPVAAPPRLALRASESPDWRDAPLAPGEWHWARQGDTSVARYGPVGLPPTLVLRCVRAAGQVLLLLPAPGTGAGQSPAQVNMTLVTSTLTRPLVANLDSSASAAGGDSGDTTPWLSVAIAKHDPLLDAMVFSRGRWRIEAQGLPPLTVPSWPEVARVVEDCR